MVGLPGGIATLSVESPTDRMEELYKLDETDARADLRGTSLEEAEPTLDSKPFS